MPTLLAASLLLVLVPQARAWGKLGHKVVAIIAQERLSPEAKQTLAGLLGPDVGLDRIANCADDMLYASEPMDCGGAFRVPADPGKKTQAWHFLNVPSWVAASDASELRAYCPGGSDCAPEQMKRWARALALSSSLEERRLALMFLVHLVADAHQPLHALDPDSVGDFKKVDYLGARKNAHFVWDDLFMPEDWKEQDRMEPAPFVARAKEAIRFDDVEALSDFDADVVLLESARLARRETASRYSLERGELLQESYRAWLEPEAYRRLGAAGVRLGALLERALGHRPLDADAALGGVTAALD